MNNRRIATILSCSLLCLFIAAPSVASIVLYDDAHVTLSVSDPVAVGDGSENLLAFDVSITGKDGYLPGAFAGSITGNLHEQQLFSLGYLTTPNLEQVFGNTVATDIDTHFNVLDADVGAIVTAAAESDATGASSEATDATGPNAGAAVTGFGTELSGDFGLGDASTVWNLAHVVVPEGSTVSFNFSTGDAVGGSGNPDVDFAGTEYTVQIPEPSTVALMALALAAIFGSRRRKI